MGNNYREKIYKNYTSISVSSELDGLNQGYLEKEALINKKYYGKFLPESKNSFILDAGCGHGGFINFLLKKGYKNSFGIDVSEEQISIGKKLGIKNLEETDILEYLKKNDGKFSLITFLDVIEHFEKDEIIGILSAAKKALSVGGKILIRVPNGESPFSGRHIYGDITHETAFTVDSCRQVLKLCGFNDISFYPVEPVVHGVKSFLRFLIWKTISFLLKAYILAETGAFRGRIVTQNLVVVAKK